MLEKDNQDVTDLEKSQDKKLDSNGTSDSGSEDASEKKFPLTPRGKWGVALLALYLLILLSLSLSWFSGLMFADTTDPENKDLSLAKCIAAAKKESEKKALADAANSNTNTNASRGNSNNNTNTSPAANTSTNTTVTNANGPANRNGSSTPVPGGVTPTPKPTATSTPADPKNEGDKGDDGNAETPGEKEDFNLNITRVVTIDTDSFIGSLFSVRSFTQNGCITADGYLFLVVLFAGMIGAIIRALIYLCWRVGTETFLFPWVWYYIFQPFMGAGMAIIVYAVIRGGFNGGAIGKGNIFTFAALAFLTALFSDNAMAKLKLIAESLLVKVDPRAKTDDKKKDGGDKKEAVKPGDKKPSPTQPSDASERTPGSMAPDEPPV